MHLRPIGSASYPTTLILAGYHLQFGVNTPAIYLIFLDIFRNLKMLSVLCWDGGRTMALL